MKLYPEKNAKIYKCDLCGRQVWALVCIPITVVSGNTHDRVMKNARPELCEGCYRRAVELNRILPEKEFAYPPEDVTSSYISRPSSKI